MATTSATVQLPTDRRTGLLGGRHARGLGLLLGCVALALVAAIALAVGAREVELGSVLAALTGEEDSSAAVIVRELRLPRVLIGIAVGAALGLAGMVMQGVTRNPVADPGILGVSAGAALAVVLAISLLGVTSTQGYLWFALLGALVASVVVYAMGSIGGGRASPVRLTLAGAVLTALLSALTMVILVVDDSTLDRFRFWDVGSLAGRDMSVLVTVLPVLAVGMVAALALGRALDTLSLGDEVAASLGQRVGRVRVGAGITIAALAGAAVAAAGPIAFVGLLVPHAARAIVGPDYRWIGLYSIVLGAILLVAADTLGRLIVRPGELQVGIMTALLGVPVFIALIRRRRLAEI